MSVGGYMRPNKQPRIAAQSPCRWGRPSCGGTAQPQSSGPRSPGGDAKCERPTLHYSRQSVPPTPGPPGFVRRRGECSTVHGSWPGFGARVVVRLHLARRQSRCGDARGDVPRFRADESRGRILDHSRPQRAIPRSGHGITSGASSRPRVGVWILPHSDGVNSCIRMMAPSTVPPGPTSWLTVARHRSG